MTPASSVPLIHVHEVTIERGPIRILDRIAATIPQFRHTAILGPNGAGKTSLLRLLTRQYYPSVEDSGHTGSVEILGRSDWSVAELRRNMGVVSATLDLNFSAGRTGRMRVEEAVASGFTATELAEFGVELTPAVMCDVERALQQVAAMHLLGRSVETLSTGERRRVLIARALVHRPAILVLDEPTTGLDLAARHTFLGILQSLTVIEGLTVVLVTHHIEEIVPGIEHVLLLDGGRITFDGPASTALTEERISALFGIAVAIDQSSGGIRRVYVK